MAGADRPTGVRSAGWYADPLTVGSARYWDGSEWTDFVSWGSVTRRDPRPLADVERCEAITSAAIVAEYLDDAVRREVVSPSVAGAIQRDLDLMAPTDSDGEPVPLPFPSPAAPPPSTVLFPTLPPPPTSAPLRPAAPAPPARGGTVKPLQREPGRLMAWMSEAQDAIRSDVALHGLAYLGVLLLFAGVTGLIAFSFAEVTPWVRSLTELLVPASLFVSAWYLHQRGAIVVASSLTLLGGAISPIVAATALTDGASVPPDATGAALPIAQGVAAALVAVVMTAVVARSPRSALRFLVGPVLWLAVGLAAGALRDPVPAGYDTARPDSMQLAVMLAALMVTVGLCSWRRIPDVLAGATRLVALPAAGTLYVLELVLAGDADWPLVGTIVVGFSALILLELSIERLTPQVASIIQLVVVVTTAARLSTKTTPEWVAVGAAITLLVAVEYLGWRRPVKVVAAVGLALAGGAFLLTLTSPWSTAVAFGILTAWGLWRHASPTTWLPATDEFGVVPAVAATVTAIALWQLSEPASALLVTASIVLALAAAGRLWPAVSDDAMWQWFMPASAAAALTASVGALSWGEAPVEVGAAAAALAGAVALSALPVAARTWAAAAIVTWSLANFAEATDIPRDAQALLLAAVALALVVGSLVLATRICAHLATIGHVAGLAALSVPQDGPGWAVTGVLAAATVAWWATAFIDQRSEAVHLAAWRALSVTGSTPLDPPTRGGIDEMAPLLSFAGLGATVVLAVDSIGWIAGDDPWATAVVAGAVLVSAFVVRVTPWRRGDRVVLGSATVVAAGITALVAVDAVGTDADHWAPVVCLGVALAVIAVMSGPRPLGITWAGWVAVAAFSLYSTDRLGLGRDWTDVALIAWGATAMVGGLAIHRRRHGPVPTGTFVRDRLLLPPIVLGAAAFVAGGISGLADGTDDEIGWTAAGMSVVVLAASALFPLGVLVALAEALATAAYVLVAPWEPIEEPWTLAPWTLALLLAALATRQSGSWSPARWDLPSFVAAHGVAGIALVSAPGQTQSSRPTSSTEVSPLPSQACCEGGSGRRQAPRSCWSPASTRAGVACPRAAPRRDRAHRHWSPPRPDVPLGPGRAGRTVPRWSVVRSHRVAVVGPADGVLHHRAGRRCRRTACGNRVAGPSAPRPRCCVGDRWFAHVHRDGCGGHRRDCPPARRADRRRRVAASGHHRGAIAPLVHPALRWVSAALAVAAWGPAAWALEPTGPAGTLLGTALALAVLMLAVVVHARRPGGVWAHPGAFYAVVLQIAAALPAIDALPDSDLLVIVLLALGAELVALGVLSGVSELYVLSPAPACVAWIVYARDALSGDANWFTAPIGFTLLVMVGLLRWIRRGRGVSPTGYDVVALELVGMSFLVGSPLALTLGGHLWNAVPAIGIGVLLAGWGAMTRVRWRAAFGAVSVVVATILLVGVPLSKSITWEGPALWLAISGIGIVAIVIASAIERGRDRMRHLERHLAAMTAGWERIPLPGKENDEPETPWADTPANDSLASPR